MITYVVVSMTDPTDESDIPLETPDPGVADLVDDFAGLRLAPGTTDRTLDPIDEDFI
jgi:hypothetical protein